MYQYKLQLQIRMKQAKYSDIKHSISEAMK